MLPEQDWVRDFDKDPGVKVHCKLARVIMQPFQVAMPSVSVIIPVYNSVDTLPRALDSVLAQSRAADEIVVIDDGSTDHTPDIMQLRYPGVHYYYREHRGTGAALNTGIRKTRGNWIAFLDACSEWLPNKLELQLGIANHDRGCRVVYGTERTIREGGQASFADTTKGPQGMIFDLCLSAPVISLSTAMIHRTALDQLGGFDESPSLCSEYDFWLRLCSAYPVACIDAPAVNRFDNPGDGKSGAGENMQLRQVRSLVNIIDSGTLTAPQEAVARKALNEKCSAIISDATRYKRWHELAYHQSIIDRLGNADDSEPGMDEYEHSGKH